MSEASKTPPTVVILGIGNVLWADEGFGVRAVEHLHLHWELPENVSLVEGGTQGIYLLEHVQAASVLVILDAIDYGLEPGTLKLIEDDSVPSYLGAKKVSLHQTGFQEVLATAAMLDSLPERLLLVGVQPKEIDDFGGSLHPLVRAQVVPALEAALAWLEPFGIHAQRRNTPLESSEALAGGEIGLDRYEVERPAATTACRVGDERVLGSERYRVAYRPQVLEPGAVSVDVDPRGKN